MNSEERKEYNKKYYASKKAQILEKACTKVQCQFCQRFVIQNGLARHQETPICNRYQQKLIKQQERLALNANN